MCFSLGVHRLQTHIRWTAMTEKFPHFLSDFSFVFWAGEKSECWTDFVEILQSISHPCWGYMNNVFMISYIVLVNNVKQENHVPMGPTSNTLISFSSLMLYYAHFPLKVVFHISNVPKSLCLLRCKLSLAWSLGFLFIRILLHDFPT